MNLIQFITTKRFVKHLGISLLLTIAISWITLTFLQSYTKHGSTVEVPSFVGLTLEDIDNLESASDFDLTVVDSVYDYDKKGGMIVSQDPLPKSKVKPGRSIYLSVVAYVPEQIKMPALVDLSLRQAKALLQTYGLKLGSVRMIPDPAKNAIIKITCKGKYIQPGSLISKGSTIDLYVGSGTGGTDVQIPFLIGKSRAEAISEITRLGLLIGSEDFQSGSDSISGRVYLQDPTYVYGKRIPVSSGIQLTYKSDDSFDFDTYIQNMVIDTIINDSIQ